MTSTDTDRLAEKLAAPTPEWHATPEGLASHRSALDQIAKLADWLVANTGEPKASYGAVDAAINAMTELTRERDDALSLVEQLQGQLDKAAEIHHPVEAYSRWLDATYSYCWECSDDDGDGSRGHVEWPCSTAKALGLGEGADDAM